MATSTSASKAPGIEAVVVRKKTQTFLDFGQKQLTAEPCKQCGMAYQRGRTDDEHLHKKFHRAWQRRQDKALLWHDDCESIVCANGSVQIVDAHSPQRIVKRALAILNLANEHLGACKVDVLGERKVFLFIDKGRVCGCILAERIDKARRLVPGLSECQGGFIRVVCGISRIWVVPGERRRGVGVQMVRAVAMRFVYGCPVGLDQLAFTQPTDDGRALAERVFGRRDFLVYVEE
ncbi:hypothetical protein DL89DRAFT_266156 [Linderina pennispora]|uniref:N-acetyltransferase ECO1 n=1 Tax=Linderina pennispora TaxID=61395 RepID=A0A1Y1WC77_9FUNG|nr:uncharacterized protein DL89DRAFT_266156 [Linderina pennispora]ORX71143.1 hypothetical protein DL89DRAFT_266156 [Linderina pennispora]